jgi:response regulator NasT
MTGEKTLPVRIAVAEDEADLRNVFVALLKQLGHEVVCAVSNGAELIDLCFKERVDVVLVDLDMPIMDGLAAAEEISSRGIPVVLISGHPDADSVVMEHEPVVIRILKPATRESLQEAIEHALASRR